jgi:ABC-type amino acid transport substrate-binding protein
LARTYVAMRVMPVYHSPEEAMDALTRGEADAVITDSTSAHQYMDAHSGALNLLSPTITDEPYVIAMPFGAFGLADSVNATIERLRSSGELSTMMGIITK